MGSLYRRGKIWWLKYYQDGRRCRETSGSISKREAEKLLRKREGAIASGTFTGIAPEKTTLRELGRDLLNDYKMNGKRTLGQVERYVNRLDQYFGAARVQQITTDTVRSYIVWRQASTNQRTGKKPSNASINRELSALRRMLNLGRQAAKVITGPHVPLLRENNVRQGFLHHHDYLRLMGAVPSYLRPVLSLAYNTGLRKAEVLSLRWSQVDLNEGLIRLEPGTTKNRHGRSIPVTGDLYEELESQQRLHLSSFPSCSHVFFNHRTGRPIKDFRCCFTSVRFDVVDSKGLKARLTVRL